LFRDEPFRQSAQFTRTGSHFAPLKSVLAVHGYVCDHHRQHPFVHIDSGNSVRHLPLLPGAERMPKIKLFRVSSCCRGYHDYSAHSFAQQRMRRTSQLVGLNLSTGRSISLLLDTSNVAKARSIFMTFRELCRTRRLNSARRWIFGASR
jgi:hypothetical protein